MRCKICDTDSDSVTLTNDCAVCEAAIMDCIAGYLKSDDGDDELTYIVDEEFDGGGIIYGM